VTVPSFFSYLCIYDLDGPVRNVFDACISITRVSGRGYKGYLREVSGTLQPLQYG
jgi:hypothetical protein